MIIQQIRNATLKIEYGKAVFLIDPWLQDQGTGFSAKAVKPEMQGVRCPLNALPESPEGIIRGVDFCLVTHLHFDHFCPDYLPKNLMIIAQNQQDAATLKEMGFKRTEAFESEQVTIGNVIVHKTKAVHGDGDAVVKKMGDVCGYVFEAPGEKSLYLAGDTIYCSAVETVIEQYCPEIIILNCCEATTPLGRLVMNLSDIEKVCIKAPRATVIASHLDSVNHALLTSEDIKKFAREKKLAQIQIPDVGECIVV